LVTQVPAGEKICSACAALAPMVMAATAASKIRPKVIEASS
jgi:hypothetical protein